MSAMVPAATVILATRSSVCTSVSYTSCFMCIQRKKSRHVRSGNLGGQPTGLPRPNHRFPKVALRSFLTARLIWAGAISIHRPVYQMHVSHFSMRKLFHVHSCCRKAVMIATESVCFKADIRAVLNVSTDSHSARPTQQLMSEPLTKCSLTLQIDFRNHMFLIEIYLL